MRFSFYDSLLWSILALVAAVCVLLLMYKIAVIKHTRFYGGTLPENYYLHRTYALLIVYLLLFVYPVASVKLVKAFSCHEINGVSYLRAAYDVRCYGSEWQKMATFAGFFIAMYVTALPIFLVRLLFGYTRLLDSQHPTQDRQRSQSMLEALKSASTKARV
jgi:hypothetical protein